MAQSSRIHKLEDQLANQIAAGEVVERPGSALKELVENSLDAGAKSVRVSLRDGGATLLEVADDGHGIHSEDMLLALDRHATSKIRRTEDLFAIQSWGFRGEALASIAAVSRLTISSRREGEATGREIVCEGGVIREDRAVARPVGTTVRVEDLFFNTPARKKFQKSQSAESTFCSQTFHRLALGSPECSFELHSNGERLFHYGATEKMENRVAEVYRSSWKLAIEESEVLKVEAASGSSSMRLKAWILPSKHFIPSSRGILLYVNRRSVKDKLLQQSVLAAAKEVLFGSLYPQLVLFLETEAEGVDVNVHPAKSEVRFRDSGHVFAFVRKHVEQALAGDRRGSVDFPSSPAAPEHEVPSLFTTAAHFHQKAVESQHGWVSEEASATLSPAEPPARSLEDMPSPYSGPQFLGTLKNTYLLCQDENGLLLVDQHAAHERVTYERLKKSRLARMEGAPLLIPIQVELGREALDRLESEFPRFAACGLVLDRTGPTLLAVREVPALLLKRDGAPVISIGAFLRKLGQGWEEQGEGEFADYFREKLLDVLASESCHGSVRAGQTLSAQEAMALLAQMAETDFSGHCPHGRPTTVRFRWSEIERLFKRVF